GSASVKYGFSMLILLELGRVDLLFESTASPFWITHSTLSVYEKTAQFFLYSVLVFTLMADNFYELTVVNLQKGYATFCLISMNFLLMLAIIAVFTLDNRSEILELFTTLLIVSGVDKMLVYLWKRPLCIIV